MRPRAKELVGTVDLGGTHVTAGLVDVATFALRPGSVHTRSLDARGGRDETIVATMREVQPAASRWGLAVPGPFDYAAGVAHYHGVGKFETLAGLDMRAALARRLDGVAPADLVFRNDADAFLLGEWAGGSVQGHDKCVGLTFGTGVGSAFMVDGEIVEDAAGVPPEGRVDLLTYECAPIEETFSRRGLLRAYGSAPTPGFDVKDLVERADAGEERARTTIAHATNALCTVLAPWLATFAPTALVVGGAISRSWRLLQPMLSDALTEVTSLRVIAPARLGDTAPLLGAAYSAVAGRGGVPVT